MMTMIHATICVSVCVCMTSRNVLKDMESPLFYKRHHFTHAIINLKDKLAAKEV